MNLVKIKRRLAFAATGTAVIYLFSYMLFRAGHTEVWAENGRAYVVFPEDLVAIYYCYRPIANVDGALTGIGFHIGPHG